MKKNILNILSILIISIVFSGCVEDGTIASSESGDIYEDGVLVSSYYATPKIELITTLAGSSVKAMVIDSDDNIYISEDNDIYKVTKDGTKTTFKTDIGTIQAMAVDGDNNLYVAEKTNKKIHKYNPNGSSSTLVVESDLPTSYFYYIKDMAVDQNNNLYFIDTNYNDLYKKDLNGTLKLMDYELYYPQGIVINSYNELCIMEYTKITKINTNGVISTIYSDLTNSDILKINKNNILYTLNDSYYGDVINKITSSGEIEAEPLVSEQLTDVKQIAFNSYGNMYVVNTDKLYKVTRYVESNIPSEVTLNANLLTWHSAIGSIGYNVYSSATDNGTYIQENTDIIVENKYTVADANLSYKVASVLVDGNISAKSTVARVKKISSDDLLSSGSTISFTTDGWTADTTSYAGSSSAKSKAIGSNESTCIQTIITGIGTLSFQWKVSSESSYDYLKFYVNDVEQVGKISGEINWSLKTYSQSIAGNNTYKWCYSKDGGTIDGSDAGWLDNVEFD